MSGMSIDKFAEKALKELEIRRKIRYEQFHPRNSGALWDFFVYWDPNFFTKEKENILRPIANDMQAVIVGAIKNLIVCLPPGTGKSYMASLTSTWAIGYYPEGSIMRNSANADLARGFSRHIRGFIEDDRFKAVFKDVRLSKTNKSVDGWSVNNSSRASYSCAGVSGNSTGKRFTLVGIVDDPIRGHADCTPSNLKFLWNWFYDEMWTRTYNSPAKANGEKAGIIVIQTRWHTDDLAGQILQFMPNDWKEHSVKALQPDIYDDNAVSFCEAIYSTEELKKRVEAGIASGSIGSFLALYQQEPVNETGALFNEEQLTKFTINDLKGRELLATYMHIDMADQGNDFLSAPIVREYNSVGTSDKYMVDCVFDQSGLQRTMPKLIEKIRIYQPTVITVETNNGGRIFMTNLQLEINKLKLDIQPTVIGHYQTSNKHTRILTSAPEIVTNIKFLEESERSYEYHMFMNNLTRYSKDGKNAHDDAPDSLSAIMKLLRSRSSTVMNIYY